jgi:outer membrane protein assembly factor BamB
MLLAAFFTIGLASRLCAQAAPESADWPQWRGPKRDGISTETGLLKQWPKDGPKVLWQVDTVGVGYSSISIKDGRIFTQGDLDGVEHVIALDLKDGHRLWAVRPDGAARWLDQQVAAEFKKIDRNGDGVIDEVEALQRFGWDFNAWDKPAEGVSGRAEKLFARLDANKDGKLSFAEAGPVLRDLFARIDAEDKTADPAALAKERTKGLIAELDKNGDGKLDRKEAKGSALDSLFDRIDQKVADTQKGDGFLTAEEMEAYFLKQEKGKDGVILPAELAAFYAKQAPKGDGILTQDELKFSFGGYRDGTGDGPRGTPTVDGDRVYSESALGDLTCLEAATGKTIWHVNLSRDLAGGRPGWGYSESPLVMGDHLIVTPGGKKGTIAALDKKTGAVVWRSEGVTEGAQYSSPQLVEIGGVRQIVQFANASCFGVTADGGKPLWKYGAANNGTANCTTPIVYSDCVFASSAYGTGGGLAKISTDGAAQKADQVYFEKKMANHHGGIVKVGDWMYGFGSSLMCMNFMTGEIKWQARSVSKGSLVVADGMLYLLGEGHEMALAEVSPDEYRERGRFKLPTRGRPSWAHPVVAGGRLYLRDQNFLTVYDVKAP